MKMNFTYTAQRIMVVIFILVALFAGYFILQLSGRSKNDWIKNKKINAKVIAIYDGYKGKPKYRRMLLADSQSFTIPAMMLDILQVGDSVVKEKGSSFYLFVLQKTKEKIKAGWN